MNKEKVLLLARVTKDGYLLGTTNNFTCGYDEEYFLTKELQRKEEENER